MKHKDANRRAINSARACIPWQLPATWGSIFFSWDRAVLCSCCAIFRPILHNTELQTRQLYFNQVDYIRHNKAVSKCKSTSLLLNSYPPPPISFRGSRIPPSVIFLGSFLGLVKHLSLRGFFPLLPPSPSFCIPSDSGEEAPACHRNGLHRRAT